MKPPKQRPIAKFLDGEKYTFISGKAIVPGLCIFGKPVELPLAEFNELKEPKPCKQSSKH